MKNRNNIEEIINIALFDLVPHKKKEILGKLKQLALFTSSVDKLKPKMRNKLLHYFSESELEQVFVAYQNPTYSKVAQEYRQLSQSIKFPSTISTSVIKTHSRTNDFYTKFDNKTALDKTLKFCMNLESICRNNSKIVIGASNNLFNFIYSLFDKKLDNVSIYGAVCADYNKDFSLGDGISPSARTYMYNSPRLLDLFDSFGITPTFSILLADTESDMPEVLNRLTDGDLNEFTARCQQSVNKINEQSDNRIIGYRFRDFFSSDCFYKMQETFEDRIKKTKSISTNNYLGDISTKREFKYRDILGRNENDFELTIRYMAQYMAFSVLLRNHVGIDKLDKLIFVNYESPNVNLFNNCSLTRYDPLDKLTNVTVPIIKILQ